MIKNLIFSAILILVLLNTGCLSLINAAYQKSQILEERIYASGDEKAINMLKLGYKPATAFRAIDVNEGIGLGIDVNDPTLWDGFKKDKIWSTVCGIGDALITGYTIKSYNDAEDDKKDKKEAKSKKNKDGINIEVNNSNDTDINIVNGDNNSENNESDNDNAAE